MIEWSESQIILAIIGCIGLLSSFAVVSRSFRANDRNEKRLMKQRQLNIESIESTNEEVPVN